MKKITFLTLMTFLFATYGWQANAQYCGPLNFTSVEPITFVEVADISNRTSASSTTAQEDFTAIVGNVEPGSTYQIALEGNTKGNYSNRFFVFIDWNQNDVLDDPGEVYIIAGTLKNSTGADGKQLIDNIVVPAGAALGNTRMRVKKTYGSSTNDNPCVAQSPYGQAEDYTINVQVAGGGGGGGDIADCAADTPIPFDAPYDISSTLSIAETGVIGTSPGDYHFDSVVINVQDGYAGDLVFTLKAPSGATLILSSHHGGGSGLNNAQTLTFTDSSGNNVGGWLGTVPLADYQPEGGLLNDIFAGEPVNGDWMLRIEDTAAYADGGSLNSFCLNMSANLLGTPPIIACPGDIMADTDPGVCGAQVSFGNPAAIDPDGGVVTVTQTMGDPSGSVFPTGDSIIEFTATDDQGESSTCQFTITVTDEEAPITICQNITVDLDAASGTVSITAADVDNGSTDNCGIASMVLDVSLFDCSMTGDNTVTLTVTDDAGNVSTCTSTVTVQDVTGPEIVCIGGFGTFTESEDFETSTIPTGWSTVIETGAQDWTFGSGVMPTGPAFASNAAIFDDDAAGSGEVNLARLLSPVYDLAGASNVQLSFDYSVQDIAGAGKFTAEVYDGATWQEILVVDDMDVAPVNSGAIDVSSYANANFQVRYTYDDEGDWAWGAGVDNFLLNYDASSGDGYDVTLDANGSATIDPAVLIASITEACGYIVTTAGVTPVPGSIETIFSSNNGGNSGGVVYFDITVGPQDVNISDIDINTADLGAFTMDVYTLEGSYVDNTGDAAAWGTPISSAGTASGTIDVPSNAVLDTPLILTAGTTYGMALVLDANHAHSYSGTGADPSPAELSYSNNDLSLALGSAANVPFDGAPITPRIFNGRLNYTAGTPAMSSIDFDCSNLGENLIDIMVTDDSGNSSTCTAVVNVIDNTPPVLICQDTTIELGPDGTTTIDPMALLGVAPTTFNAMVIGSANGSGNEGFTDFTVDVTEAAAISFDWNYTSNDVAGFDSFGYILNGTYTQLSDPTMGNQSGNASVALAAGDVFGLRSQTDDNIAGNNETVVSNFMPGFTGQFAPANWTLNLTESDGDAFFVEIPGGPLSFDACGITILAVDVTEVSCADIGTPVTITIFASDASGNVASCTSVVTVVDTLAPEITCPADQTVDPGAGNLFYILPDYFATGEATADDNCTEPVTITTQDPAPGIGLPDGPHTITLTATDEYGNTSTCSFVLTVETILGNSDNALSSGVSLYPNPASSVVNLVNKSNISLKTMTMFDVNGKQVSQVNLSGMQGEKAVDISSLASGVYIVQIVGDKASTVKRLIKE